MVTQRRLYQLYEAGGPGLGIDADAIVGLVDQDHIRGGTVHVEQSATTYDTSTGEIRVSIEAGSTVRTSDIVVFVTPDVLGADDSVDLVLQVVGGPAHALRDRLDRTLNETQLEGGALYAAIRRTNSFTLITSLALDGPDQTYSRWIAISEDTVFSVGEVTVGNSSITADLVVPDFTSPPLQYIGIVVPDLTGDIIDIQEQGVSVFPVWRRISGTISFSGTTYKVWRTHAQQNDLASGKTYTVTQAQ